MLPPLLSQNHPRRFPITTHPDLLTLSDVFRTILFLQWLLLNAVQKFGITFCL